MRLFVLSFLFVSLVDCLELSKQGILNAVNAHNKHRAELAQGLLTIKGVAKPHASNMMKIKWSKKLATKAQEYAKTCPSNHSAVINLGENLYWHFTNKFADVDEYGSMAAENWWKEFEDNGWESTKYSVDQRHSIGHAIQMSWHESRRIGCGISKCNEGENNQNIVVVCRYHPKGNIETEDIYAIGEPCSKCPEGYGKCEFGLCSK